MFITRNCAFGGWDRRPPLIELRTHINKGGEKVREALTDIYYMYGSYNGSMIAAEGDSISDLSNILRCKGYPFLTSPILTYPIPTSLT